MRKGEVLRGERGSCQDRREGGGKGCPEESGYNLMRRDPDCQLIFHKGRSEL